MDLCSYLKVFSIIATAAFTICSAKRTEKSCLLNHGDLSPPDDSCDFPLSAEKESAKLLRSRRDVLTAVTGVGRQELAGLLAMDLLFYLGLQLITLYTNNVTDLRWLRQEGGEHGVMWNLIPCPLPNSSPSSASGILLPLRDPCVVLLTCPWESTLQVLRKASTTEVIREHTWIVAGLEDSLTTLEPKLYIPIDSMVTEMRQVKGQEDIHLREVWSPGPGLDLKESFLASWVTPSDLARKVRLHRPDSLTFVRTPKYDRRHDLTGVHLRITSINDTRAHKSFFDPVAGREVLTGFFGEVWEILRKEMNFTYSVRTPTDGEFGAESNGTWTGLIGDLHKDEADVIVAYLSRTYSRAQAVDYSSVLIKFSYRIFARPPARSGVSWTSYTRPFSLGLWLSLVLALVLLTAAFWGVAKWYYLREKRAKIPSKWMQRFKDWMNDSSMVMWAAITQQGWPHSPEVGILRILFWTAYMLGVVVVAAYSATLVSFLTVQGDALPFDSLADIKRTGNHRLGILKGSVLEEFFKNQNFLEYWNTLIEPFPDTLAKSYKELRAQALKDSDFAYVGTYEIQRLDSVGACTFRSARQHLLFNDGSLGWPKGSPYVQLFDHFINRLRETGLLQKILTDWFPNSYACPDQPVVVMGIKQVFTAFVILGSGMLASICFLWLERMITNWRMDKYKKSEARSQFSAKGFQEKYGGRRLGGRPYY